MVRGKWLGSQPDMKVVAWRIPPAVAYEVR